MRFLRTVLNCPQNFTQNKRAEMLKNQRFRYFLDERETGIEGGMAHKPSILTLLRSVNHEFKEESTLSGAVLKFVLNEKWSKLNLIFLLRLTSDIIYQLFGFSKYNAVGLYSSGTLSMFFSNIS